MLKLFKPSKLINSNLHRSLFNSGKHVSTDRDQTITPNQLKHHPAYFLCLKQVKKYDRENYLVALCIRDPLFRRANIALRALNVELSLIRDSTTNSDRAKLRLNFWARLVEEIIRRDTEATDTDQEKLMAYYKYTPVAKELLDLFKLIDMDEVIKTRLQDLIGARLSSKVLGYKPFESINELELYCSKSQSSIYAIGWRMGLQLHQTWHMNDNIKPKLNNMSENLGIAQGLSNVIRGIPYNSSKNCCYIPQDILKHYNLTTKAFVTKNLDGNEIAPVVEFLAERCQKLLKQVYHDSTFIPMYFRQMYLPWICIEMNLRMLKKCNYNICDPRMAERSSLLPFNLWMASKYLRAPIL